MGAWIVMAAAGLVSLIDVFSGSVSSFVTAHPLAMVILSAVSTVVAALLKSPLKKD